MQTNPDIHSLVSLITVNYNGLKDTDELLRSFAQCENYPAYEFLIVDNGSEADETAELQQLHPEAKVIRNTNTGFAGGNNAALPFAKGEYIFFINNDTVIDRPILGAMVARLQSDPKIGGVSPMLKYTRQPDTLQYAGFTPFSPITLRNAAIGFGEKDSARYRQASTTASLHGAAMMVPRRVIDDVGTMTEVFFLFYEELDWSARILKAGYTLWYEPAAVVMHKESMTARKGTPLREYYLSRARMLYARRNNNGLKKGLSCIYLLAAATPKKMLGHLLKGEAGLAWAALKGTLCGMVARKE